MRQLKIANSITNRESISFEKYLQEISKVDLITSEEEVILAGLIKQGDQSAVDRLTKANLRFVVSVAKQYQFHGISLPDLINEGNLGLIKAAHRFDETKGFKFISYAVWWIRQSIIQAIYEQGRIVRVPSNKMGLSGRIQKASSLLEQEHERAPTAEELAEMLDLSLEEVRLTMRMIERHVSLDTPVSEDSSETLLDVLQDSNANATDKEMVHTHSLKLEINRFLLHALTDMQKQIVCSFFGIGEEPISLEDIGNKYNLTGERVRQIKSKAILKLRQTKKSDLLKSFL